MPHDLSRSSNHSASSSSLAYTDGMQKSVYHNHSGVEKMDVSDDEDADDNDQHSSKKQSKPKQKLNHSLRGQRKTSIVHPDMVFYCFEILGNHLFRDRHHLAKHCPTAALPLALPAEPYPLFVTWLLGSEKTLRGCIGTFTPMNLASGEFISNRAVRSRNDPSVSIGLREYALTSATNDSRFSPISRDEYPLLSCAVSILTQFEPCSSYTDWQIGLHGIRIEFLNERGAKRSATYLPEVAHEQGWNHTQTLDSLLRKGGYKASITSDMRRSVQVVRYRSEKITLHYDDYVQSKKIAPFEATTFAHWNTSGRQPF